MVSISVAKLIPVDCVFFSNNNIQTLTRVQTARVRQHAITTINILYVHEHRGTCRKRKPNTCTERDNQINKKLEDRSYNMQILTLIQASSSLFYLLQQTYFCLALLGQQLSHHVPITLFVIFVVECDQYLGYLN